MSNLKKTNQDRRGESGNVLFLILIAVALFAALSYAVTQSSRSGGGDANKENQLIDSAQVTQYPAGVRTSLVRMIIGGTSVDQLEFNTPSDFASLTSNAVGVFHPSGGGATYSTSPPSVMESKTQGIWYFSGLFEIDSIGANGTDSDGNEIAAFLPGVSSGVCKKINEQLGLGTTIPDSGADWSAAYKKNLDNTYHMNDTDVTDALTVTLGTGGTAVLSGQPFACFQNNGGDYVYYHVLIER